MRPDEDTMDAIERLFARTDGPDAAVSPWRLERYLADDLPPPERAEVAEALRVDPALARRLDALRAADASFQQEHRWEDVSQALFARAEALPAPPVRRDWRRWFAVLVPLAAALMVAVLLPKDDPTRTPNRLKGAGLTAMQLVEGVAQPLARGETVEPGDRLQLRVHTTHRWLVLLGVDGTGTVSRYVPGLGGQSEPIEPGTAVPLPESLVLDDSPGPEVFVGFLSDEPRGVAELEQALHDAVQDEGARALLTPGTLDGITPQVAVFWVEKRLP